MTETRKSNFAWFGLIMLILSTLACAQDCMGTTFNVGGYITDSEGNPISGVMVEVWNDGSFEKPPIGFTVETDANGWFETESSFSYACTPFHLRISAENYQTIEMTFSPPSQYHFSDEFPDDFTVQLQPITG